MNSITLIQTYYNDPSFLLSAIRQWNSYDIPLSVILIDDGSKKYPAIDTLENFSLKKNIKLSLYAVDDDIGFNSHGCRNLGAAVAKTDWLIFLDIDHFITPKDMTKLYTKDLSTDHWYSFITQVGSADPFPSMNTFMCTKEMFERGGGYDESYTPFHYGDRDFLNMMDSKFDRIELDDIVINCVRAGRKVIIDHNATLPIYDNDNITLVSPPFNKNEIQYHDKRLNFSWKKLI